MAKKNLTEVVTVRTWKEYLGECLLIVFSVVLALFVTEVINNINENKKKNEILKQLKEELTDNQRLETEQYHYHLKVIQKLDSVINNPLLTQKFLINGQINLDIMLPPPHVIILHDLNDVAWQIAKQNNIVSKIDISTYNLLNDIYNNQQRITNSEDKIAGILLRFESRQPENMRTTLILLRDNYIAWNVERAPRLLDLYKQAIDKLSKY